MRRLIPGKLYARYWRGKRSLRQLRDTFLVAAGKLSRDPVTLLLDRTLYCDGEGKERDFPEGAVCILDGSFHHGGLTDRLRGILSAYEIARSKGLPFYISWTHPFRLEQYLVPARADWRIAPEAVCRSRRGATLVVADDLSDFQSRLRLRAGFSLARRRRQLHLYTNADTARGRYASLFAELFRPSEKVAEETGRHRRHLTTDYHAFSFRFLTLLGDFRDVETVTLTEEERLALMEKVRRELEREIRMVPPGRSILVTSDSQRFLEYIRNLDPRIYICDGDIRHIDRDPDSNQDSELRTFAEQFLLMGAVRVTLMRTGGMYRSGFSRFAAEIGGAEFVDHHF